MRILDDLWQVGGGSLSAPEDAAVYLVRFGEKAALVDAGTGGAHDRLAARIEAYLPPGVEIEYLLLSHCHFDHTGGAEALRRHFGCQLVAHRLDADFLEKGDNDVTAASWYGARMQPLRIDRKLDGGRATLSIGSGAVRAYHWPGHSPGSLVFTASIADRHVLFGQDVHGPLHPMLRSDPEAYRRSLQLLLQLDAEVLCEGHYGVIRGRAAVREFIRSFL